MASGQAAVPEENKAALTPEEERAKGLKVGVISNGIALVLLFGIGFALNVPELAAVSLAVNWVVYLIHALPQDSEKFFDATGTLTYISLVGAACWQSGVDFTQWNAFTTRSLLLVIMSMTWAIRLGSFLLNRICQAGKDSRFDDFRKHWLRFLGVWSLQAVWCFLVISPVLVVVKNKPCTPIGIGDYVGLTIWVLAFLCEIIADNQKSAWRADPANKGKFINTGLWARSRHPNYFGEITMWIGISISVTFTFFGDTACAQWLQLLLWFSPLTTFVLLMFVSGVPLLEAQGDERWGNDPAYIWYKEHTPVVFLSITRPPPYDAESKGVALA